VGKVLGKIPGGVLGRQLGFDGYQTAKPNNGSGGLFQDENCAKPSLITTGKLTQNYRLMKSLMLIKPTMAKNRVPYKPKNALLGVTSTQ
jgi:hypothetical protein